MSDEQRTIKTGMTVMLKSGSPVMTVGTSYESGRKFMCHWFEENGKLNEVIFMVDQLMIHEL